MNDIFDSMYKIPSSSISNKFIKAALYYLKQIIKGQELFEKDNAKIGEALFDIDAKNSSFDEFTIDVCVALTENKVDTGDIIQYIQTDCKAQPTKYNNLFEYISSANEAKPSKQVSRRKTTTSKTSKTDYSTLMEKISGVQSKKKEKTEVKTEVKSEEESEASVSDAQRHKATKQKPAKRSTKQQVESSDDEVANLLSKRAQQYGSDDSD